MPSRASILRARCLSLLVNSSSVRVPFEVLHLRQVTCKLFIVVGPPRDSGIIWSRCISLSCRSSSQYTQCRPSLSIIVLRRLSGIYCFLFIFHYLRIVVVVFNKYFQLAGILVKKEET